VLNAEPGSSRRATVVHNLVVDLVAATGFGIAVAVIAGLLPSIARQSGLEPIGLAALSAAPYAANVIAVVSGRMRLHRPADVVVVRVVTYLPAILMLVLPPAGWLIVVLIFWIGNSVATPLQIRLWGLIYPDHVRGRMVSIIRTGQAAAIGVTVVVGGALADRVGGPVVAAAAGLIATALALSYLRLRLSSAAREVEPPPRYTIAEAVDALSASVRLRRLVVAQGVWGVGTIAAAPLYPLVLVDSLHLPLSEIGALGLIGSVVTTVSYLGWGVLSDRRGGVTVLVVGACLAAPAPILCVQAMGTTGGTALAILVAAGILGGLAGAANDIGQIWAISDMTTIAERRMVLAGWASVTGIRGMAAPLVSATLVQAGIVDVRFALVGCAMVQVVGLLLFIRTAINEPARSLDPAR
jgi:MFS family permease